MHLPARLLSPALVLAASLFTACVKQVEQVAPAEKPAPVDAFSTAATVAPVNQPSVAGIPSAAIAAAHRANARVEVASTNTRDHGAIFAQAKAFLAEKKYGEALAALDSIQPELLTPAQEKAVADLRKEIEARRSGS